LIKREQTGQSFTEDSVGRVGALGNIELNNIIKKKLVERAKVGHGSL
jgi:hypothetical protein